MYVSQPSAHPTSTLDERPGGSKCAYWELALKLHLGFPTCAFGANSQLVASHESTRPRATLELCFRRLPRGVIQLFSKPNFLALLLSRQSPSGDAVEEYCLMIVIWLILPVVICLSQRLSHACLSISIIQRNCEWLIKTVIVYLTIECYMDNRGNSRANTCWLPDFLEGRYLLDNNQYSSGLLWWIIITERIARLMQR